MLRISPSQEELNSLVDQLPEPFIMLGDFNGHSILCANVLGESFSKVSSSACYNPTFLAIKTCAERQSINFKTCQILPYNSPFEMFELEKALSKSRNTSPGPDRISYHMLRHLSTSSLSHILRLFNRVWTEGIFPMQWQEALVVPILKP
ncbi:hypothetical protein AVEN_30302-1, partial [Araneus ventricosus]